MRRDHRLPRDPTSRAGCASPTDTLACRSASRWRRARAARQDRTLACRERLRAIRALVLQQVAQVVIRERTKAPAAIPRAHGELEIDHAGEPSGATSQFGSFARSLWTTPAACRRRSRRRAIAVIGTVARPCVMHGLAVDPRALQAAPVPAEQARHARNSLAVPAALSASRRGKPSRQPAEPPAGVPRVALDAGGAGRPPFRLAGAVSMRQTEPEQVALQQRRRTAAAHRHGRRIQGGRSRRRTAARARPARARTRAAAARIQHGFPHDARLGSPASRARSNARSPGSKRRHCVAIAARRVAVRCFEQRVLGADRAQCSDDGQRNQRRPASMRLRVASPSPSMPSSESAYSGCRQAAYGPDCTSEASLSPAMNSEVHKRPSAATVDQDEASRVRPGPPRRPGASGRSETATGTNAGRYGETP